MFKKLLLSLALIIAFPVQAQQTINANKIRGSFTSGADGSALPVTATGGSTHTLADWMVPNNALLGAAPLNIGTGLYPVYLNHTGITATTTNTSFTFTCVTLCSNLYVGVALYNGAVWPGGTVVTVIAGTTITTNLAAIQTNASPVGVQLGIDRWSTTSTALVNNLGVRQIWSGAAALGNSTWVEQYLPGQCQYGFALPGATTVCSLMSQGDNYGTFIGSRSSDTNSTHPLQNLTLLTINDDTVNPKTVWGYYNEVRALPSTAFGKLTFGHEESMVNFNTAVQTDPYTVNVSTATIGSRTDCGNGGVGTSGLTATDCATGSEVILNTQKFFTAYQVGDGALNTSILTHPPAYALNSGANGYAITAYKAAGYSTPAWQLYFTSTTTNGNLWEFGDSSVTWKDATNTYFSATTTGMRTARNGGTDVLHIQRLDAVASGTLGQISFEGLNSTPTNTTFANILGNATSNTAGAEAGSISLQTVNAGAMATRVTVAGAAVTLASGVGLTLNAANIATDTTTGTKIGTATTQKLGFFNATPVVQEAGSNDVLASLVTLGLRAASSNPPLNLSGGLLTSSAHVSAGTKFTTSGCSVSSTTGGATAGTFTLGANNCTVVVTMNGATGVTAPNGWTCQAHDRTGISVVIDGESSSTTTTASIVIPVTAGATDVISFSCTGY